jgi:quercetin dioxygenase-like cupin family protein
MLAVPSSTYHLVGNIITVLSPPPGSHGKMMVAICRSRPGAGSPHNRHPDDDESFYVLTGEFEFLVDGERTRRGPGGFVSIPNGSPHQFTNTASTDSTMLIICAPGLVHDSFFREAGDPLPGANAAWPETPPDLPALSTAARRCGIEFLPDPQ